jgi:GT2 family glycosyltransferase
MIYIIIPVFNRISFTMACLQSLARQTINNFQVIVIDDGSTDQTTERLNETYPDTIVLKGDGNLWWTGSTNLGVKKALQLSQSADDYILTLNNDLVVKEDYLEQLSHAARQFPGTLIGSVSVDINAPDIIHYAGTKWNSKTASYRAAIDKDTSVKELTDMDTLLPTDLLPGRGVLIHISIFRHIGMYDQQFFPHYMADEDFALRARKAGYGLGIAPGAIIYNRVQETGLKKEIKNVAYYKNVFTSMRSPANSTYRWNWAKRHAGIPAPIYFVIDLMRILKSLIVKS